MMLLHGRTGRVGMATITVVALALLAATGLVGCGSEPTPSTTPTSGAGTTAPPAGSGEKAPDFSGVTLDGVDVSLSEYRGKPLVLAFMASW